MRCTMDFDNGFVLMQLMVAVLEVKRERILRTILYEYIAE